MKNTIYIIGVASVVIIYLGGLFKVMHWPGAGIMLMFSIAIYCLFFLPASIINHFKNNDGKKHWYIYIAGFLTAFFNFWGVLFKLMHWPGAGLLMPFAFFSPFVLFLPAFLIYSKKEKRITFTHIIITLLIFSAIGVFDALLSMNVSREVLTGSLQNEMAFRDAKKNYEAKTMVYYQNLEEPVEKIVTLKKETEHLMLQIDTIKHDVVEYISDYELNIEMSEINEHSLWGTPGLDKQNAFREVFLYNNKAAQLKKSLRQYKNFLKANGFLNADLDSLVSATIIPKDYVKPGGDIYTWESHFENLHAIMGLERLVNIQSTIRMIEKLILEKYLLEAGMV